jgi:hypothetical protein
MRGIKAFLVDILKKRSKRTSQLKIRKFKSSYLRLA